MKKIVFSTALFALLFSAALLAEGCPAMGKGMGVMAAGGGPRMILAMASELKLTADQMDKLKKLIDNMPEKGANKDEMQADRTAIQDEMKKDKPDQAKIDALVDKMAAKKKEAIKTRISNKAAVDAILTAEQKDILKKKIEEKKKEFSEKKMQHKGKAPK
jgi:Spy/CpxP family protein refolding chaperone